MEQSLYKNCTSQESMTLQKVEEYVTTALERNDAAHDMAHIRRVVNLTAQICSKDPHRNPYRPLLLAYLHEMEDDKLASNTDPKQLKQDLLSCGLCLEDVAFVLGGIPYISYRKYPKLSLHVPLEIRIVQDADRIDAMGAIGIARTFAFGGAKGRPLDESIRHFEEKLLKLYDLLSTEGGKELGATRHELLCTFYKAYKEESGN